MTAATQVAPAPPSKRVLVVEDELMIRMLLEDMLSELGYTVTAQAGRIDEARGHLDAALRAADHDPPEGVPQLRLAGLFPCRLRARIANRGDR